MSFGLPQNATARDRPGTVDRSFGGNGRVEVPGTPGFSLARLNVGLDHRGRIIVAGASAVVRLTTTGRVDRSFGQAGVARERRFQITAMAIQGDGRILVGGRAGIMRLTASGRWDPAFGVGGFVRTTLDVESLAVDQRRRVLAAGEVPGAPEPASGRPTDFAVTRLQPTGASDAAFGDHGVVRTPLRTLDQARGVAALSDGRVLVSGATHSCNPAVGEECDRFDCEVGGIDCALAVMRYTADGRLDPSFAARRGTPGVLTYPRLENGGLLVRMSDGSLRIFGWRSDTQTDFASAQIRLSADGDLDLPFGIRRIGGDFATSSVVAAVRRPDDKVLVVNSPYDSFSSIARLAPNGRPDASFGRTGGVRLSGMLGLGVAVSARGIIVAGVNHDHFALTRLHR